MSKELMTVETAKVTDQELTMHLENLGLLKDLTNGEKNSYLQIAKAFNLNPFKREIHVSKYNGQMSIITGYEVYIKRAERTGQLDGWSVVTEGEIPNLKAIVTIHRKDRKHPFIWEALYSEYVQKTKEGSVTKFWQKAHTMIKKVAISQGFRLCFSDELGGMPYTADEISNTEDTTPVSVTTEPPNHNSKDLDAMAKPLPTPWQPSAEEMQELSDLIQNSTLDAEKRTAAAIAVTECKTAKDVAKIKKRLLEVQHG